MHTFVDRFITQQIKDEYLFLDELSLHLSQRYQRPTSSVFITLDHSACLLFAGTFDSAYVLTINALPSQLLPTTNKRNTALIQSHMASSLGVLPDRGIIRFCAIADEYLATKGTTYSGHIERLQKTGSDEPKKEIAPPKPTEAKSADPKPANDKGTDPKPFESPRIVPHLTPDKSRKSNRQSLLIQTTPMTVPVPQRKFQSAPQSKAASPTLQRNWPMRSPTQLDSPPIPSIPWDNNPMDMKGEKIRKLGKRKSFWSLFGRSTYA